MDKIAGYLTKHIKNNVPGLTDLQLIKIKFGFECLFSEASKIIIYLVIFSFFSYTLEFITVLIFFTVTRSFAGGYHEETYWRCFTTTLAIFTAALYIGISFQMAMPAKIILLLVSMILAFIYAPVDHPNKPIISADRRKRLKYLSVIMIIILGLISFILPDRYSNIAIMSILAEALSLIPGYLKKSDKNLLCREAK